MYQTIGSRTLLTVFCGLCAAVLVIWVLVQPPVSVASVGSIRTATDFLLSWWKVVSGSVSAVGLLALLIGQTACFDYLCRLPGLRKVFPPISGKWTVTLESNWAAIQQRAAGTNHSPTVSTTVPAGGQNVTAPPTATLRTPVSATATIIARLFFVRVNLESDNRYSTSKTLSVNALRDLEDGAVTLHYVYRNTTSNPLPTDSASHEGAACLEVLDDGKVVRLEGRYWTNRNWHHGLNTAGLVRFDKLP